MTKQHRRIAATVTALGASIALLAGCSGGGAPAGTGDAGAGVTITVTGKPSDDQPEQLNVFNDRIAAFEDRHPHITVVGSDKGFDPQTFNAMLAGGTLPDLYVAYFTDSRAIIANGQATDITEAIMETDLPETLNPATLAFAQDDDDRIYGIPFSAYGLGLVYNRALFEQAGLDPETPPTTWEGVREAAKAITDATGVPGFGTMTQTHTGGWMLTAASFSYGGTMQEPDGTPTFAADGNTSAYLELLKTMRFTDASIGDNILYDQAGIGQALAANQVGMFIGSPSSYGDAVVTNGMNAADFGMGAMPQHGGNKGTLTGGGVFMMSPNVDEAQKAAIILYVQEIYLNGNFDETTALDNARADAAENQPVGLPGLSVFTQDNTEQVNVWIKDYINTPQSNFTKYTESLRTIPLVPEPPQKAQDMYSLLDSVVQSVLTDRGADIARLLDDAATTFTARLDR